MMELLLLYTVYCAAGVAVLTLLMRLATRGNTPPTPPGPWPLPLIGSLLHLDARRPYVTLRALARKYGPVYQLRLGQVRTVVLARADLIRSAFGTEAATGRAPLYLTFGIMEGMGLICSEGALWREHRRFTVGVMRALGMKAGVGRAALESRILKAAQDTAKDLGSPSSVSCVDPSAALLHSLGNSMNLLIFGIAYERGDPVWLRLQQLLDEGSKLIGIAGAINFLPWLRFLPHYRRTIKFIKENQVKSHAVYEELIQSFQETQLDKDTTNSPRHFIEAYLQESVCRSPDEGGSFSRRQLHYAAADLFGAGTETTLTTLRWLLLDLASNPHHQTAVYTEIARVAAADGSVITSDLAALTLTYAALLETQRLHPVVPIGVPHGVTQDLTIAGYHVPRGTMLIPLLAEVHMDPKYWDHPDEYRPQRFIDSDTGDIIRHASFMPFQVGRRVCPGEDFARMVLLLYVTQILLLYELKLPRDVRVHQQAQESSNLLHKQTDGNNDNKTSAKTNNKPTEGYGNDNDMDKSAIKKQSDCTMSPLSQYTVREEDVDMDPFADPICGFTASARPYKLILLPRSISD